MEEFDALPIDRGYISELHIATDKIISLRVIAGPFESADSVTGKAVRVYEIRFEPLHAFRLNAHAGPWLEIISHNAEKGNSEGDASHFQVICEEGTLDIFAGACHWLLIEEVVYVGRHEVKPG